MRNDEELQEEPEGADFHQEARRRMRRKICAFIEGTSRNCWLETRQGKVYIRKSVRIIHNVKVDCLDMASIEATPPGRGFGTAMLELFEAEAGLNTRAVYVECVHSTVLQSMLKKRGYEYIDSLCWWFKKEIEK